MEPRRATLVLLFALALGARLTLLFFGPWHDPDRALRDDSRRYVLLATNLREYGRFGKTHEDGLVHQAIESIRERNGTLPAPDEFGLRPETFRTPGYPVFLLLTSRLWGLQIALLVQCVLGALLAPTIAAIAMRLGLGSTGAFVAGLFWALHPCLVLYDCLILTESTFNIAIVAGLGLITVARGWPSWCLAGLSLGLAGLIRPLAVLYLPCYVLLNWQRGTLRLGTSLVLLAATLVPSGLWAWRNQSIGAGFRVTTVGHINLLFYSAAYSIAEERGEDWLQSWPDHVAEMAQRLGERVEPGDDVIAAVGALGMEELRARPWATLRVHAKSAAKLLFDHSCGDAAQVLGLRYQPSGLLSLLGSGRKDGSADGHSLPSLFAAGLWTGCNAAVVVLALVGLVRAARNRLGLVASACGLTIVLFVLATGSVGLERMRLPIMPSLCLLVGCAFIRRELPAAVPS